MSSLRVKNRRKRRRTGNRPVTLLVDGYPVIPGQSRQGDYMLLKMDEAIFRHGFGDNEIADKIAADAELVLRDGCIL